MGATRMPDLARRNRDFLRALYGNAKELDAHIRFVFLTGVSKFSKVSLFSDLNNLEDITIDLESMVASHKILSAFDVEHMSTEALLFQTGTLRLPRRRIGAAGCRIVLAIRIAKFARR